MGQGEEELGVKVVGGGGEAENDPYRLLLGSTAIAPRGSRRYPCQETRAGVRSCSISRTRLWSVPVQRLFLLQLSSLTLLLLLLLLVLWEQGC